MSNAPHVYPVTRRFVGVGTELNPGTPVVPTFTLPLTTFTPVDKITYLQDKAWRNAMAGLYNMIPGPIIGDISLGRPFFRFVRLHAEQHPRRLLRVRHD